MKALVFTFVLTILYTLSAQAKAPEVVVYGASWCGPCRSLKAFLEKAGVAHEFRDVDDPNNLEAFERAAMGKRGIPLTVVNGRERIRGFAPEQLLMALGREAEAKAAKAEPGVTSYGGKTAQEWQREFRELRAYQKTLEARVAQIEKVAEDDVETATLERLKKQLAMAEDSLVLLDNDASRYALPRQYRQ